ncbi:metabolite traffic protein EboE [Maribacter sp. 2304DJ31-5]|uniref:metabolite traffic protein EboE n=1 Tax=Maribacter sp. 2304DJ31-5 TaxID=3386273 RepID=UPI0039BC5AFA
MHIAGKYQLSYCTNIHPGQDWETTFENLKRYVPEIKKAVSADKPFGLGLRLSNKASEELAMGDRMANFQKWLTEEDVYVFTMNGFPYGNFHDERVKDKVHAPDWTTQERLVYTNRLFDQLAVLLPSNVSGGISTSPISYRHWHAAPTDKKKVFEKGAENMIRVALHLSQLEKSTGKYMHLDIEPEPDGLLENTDEVLSFFSDHLIPMGIKILENELNLNDVESEKLIKRYITICYDICHFSLAYEEPEITFKKFRSADVQVGKIQVSAALKVIFGTPDHESIWNALAQFNEPTYLHQVTEQKDGIVKTYNDLPQVLEKKDGHKELRAHFHVPIFLERYGNLFSTQDHIIKTLDYLKDHVVSEHLEIETYTWDVLPKDLKQNLTESIIREIEWLKTRIVR